MGKISVGIVMGSTSDWDVMKHAAQQLKDFGISYDARALSAHRSPDLLIEWIEECEKNGVQCFVAGAGGAYAEWNGGEAAAVGQVPPASPPAENPVTIAHPAARRSLARRMMVIAALWISILLLGGGFALEVDFTATGLRELAKMDGAVIVDGEVTRILRAAVQLLPENPDFEPIELDLRRDPLTIEGVVVGVIRAGKI